MSKLPDTSKLPLSEEEVREFLLANPDFLKNNTDLFAIASAPERELGDGIIDFQNYLVKNLQTDSKALKNKYDVLVDFCRDNIAVQSQVHKAVLGLIRSRSLEQLLETITIDLVSLFDVDVVRLAMESDKAGEYESFYSENNYSGIVFIEPGIVDYALGAKKNVLLIADIEKRAPIGFDQIFADCYSMIQSCALLRLELEQVQRNIILAFGVRYPDRFHPGQGIELLNFLAQIVAHQLDRYLGQLDI
jgi:uncharacterized protein YigA (DUF484 family)